MANFEVGTEQRADDVIVRISGDLDLSSFDAVDEVLVKAQSNGNRMVKVDLKDVEFIDSSGIRLLLVAHQRSQDAGHELCIVRGSERVQRVFALTDLDGRLPFCEDEA